MGTFISAVLRKIICILMSGIFIFGTLVEWWPCRPVYREIDLTKFELTFSDEFDGDKLDDVWALHMGDYDNTIIRRGSYWNRALAEVYDGNLHIGVKYLENGINEGDPSGWYTAGIDTDGRFEQTYGYFETRCILPEGAGLWSAFWLYTHNMGLEADNGRVGAEIDVYESPNFLKEPNNVVSSNVHIGGYGEHHDSAGGMECLIEGNPYKEYNTYGVEWNKFGYTFYVNGRKWRHANIGGASQVDEFMILSIEIGGKNGCPADDWAGNLNDNPQGKAFTSDFIVDYVRAYQYKPSSWEC